MSKEAKDPSVLAGSRGTNTKRICFGLCTRFWLWRTRLHCAHYFSLWNGECSTSLLRSFLPLRLSVHQQIIVESLLLSDNFLGARNIRWSVLCSIAPLGSTIKPAFWLLQAPLSIQPSPSSWAAAPFLICLPFHTWHGPHGQWLLCNIFSPPHTKTSLQPWMNQILCFSCSSQSMLSVTLIEKFPDLTNVILDSAGPCYSSAAVFVPICDGHILRWLPWSYSSTPGAHAFV